MGREVKFMAAIDGRRGLASKQMIPWNLPADKTYYRELLATGPVVMGYNTYMSHGRKPFSDYENFVLSRKEFEAENVTVVSDLHGFFKSLETDIWVAGGGQVFAAALPYATKLYLTRVQGDFGCDVFFPEFETDFSCIERSDEHEENGIKFRFEIWEPKPR